jgi:hypothetical protein
MQMTRNWYASATLGYLSVTIPLLAANPPQTGTGRQNTVVWRNDDLERLHGLGLIYIVGHIEEKRSTSASASAPYARTQDPEWYAVRAIKLRDELEHRQAQLCEYRLALDDVRSLSETVGGIDLDDGEPGIPPGALRGP